MLLSWAASDRLCDLKKTHNFPGPSSPNTSHWGAGADPWFLPRNTVSHPEKLCLFRGSRFQLQENPGGPASSVDSDAPPWLEPLL